jgi:cell fate (sporulation/competence/biofilm development) regulator YlbF (YheA/YmcA/DUF963 family)
MSTDPEVDADAAAGGDARSPAGVAHVETDVDVEPADVDTESTTPEALGRALGDAIAATEEYEAFAEAKAAVEDDEAAQAAISAFERQRSEFTLARQTGSATQADLRALQSAQRELHALPVMETYLDAQEALQERLEGINEAVSAPLSVDFGGEAGGCCHD